MGLLSKDFESCGITLNVLDDEDSSVAFLGIAHREEALLTGEDCEKLGTYLLLIKDVLNLREFNKQIKANIKQSPPIEEIEKEVEQLKAEFYV